jgi:hypothetical protein
LNLGWCDVLGATQDRHPQLTGGATQTDGSHLFGEVTHSFSWLLD